MHLIHNPHKSKWSISSMFIVYEQSQQHPSVGIAKQNRITCTVAIAVSVGEWGDKWCEAGVIAEQYLIAKLSKFPNLPEENCKMDATWLRISTRMIRLIPRHAIYNTWDSKKTEYIFGGAHPQHPSKIYHGANDVPIILGAVISICTTARACHVHPLNMTHPTVAWQVQLRFMANVKLMVLHRDHTFFIVHTVFSFLCDPLSYLCLYNMLVQSLYVEQVLGYANGGVTRKDTKMRCRPKHPMVQESIAIDQDDLCQGIGRVSQHEM